MFDNDILKSIIKSISVIIAGLFGLFQLKKMNKKSNKSNSNDSTLLVSFEQINDLNETIYDMFKHTTADRFLLFVTDINKGKNSWISAVYEQHKKINETNLSLSYGATNRYIKLNIDEEYKNIIMEAKLKGVKKLTTDTMSNSILKSIYTYEKIKHSSVYFIFEYVDDGNDMILFCSISKHLEEKFSIEDEIYFKMIIDKITNNIFKI